MTCSLRVPLLPNRLYQTNSYAFSCSTLDIPENPVRIDPELQSLSVSGRKDLLSAVSRV